MNKRFMLLFLILLLQVSLQAQQGSGAAIREGNSSRNVIKVSVFSPLTGHVAAGYERWLKNGISLEVKAGIMNAGVNMFTDVQRGFYVRTGPKFLFSPDYMLPGQRRSHPLHGAYLRPEIAFGWAGMKTTMYDDFPPYDSHELHWRNLTGAVLINIGKQWVLADFLTLDVSVGAGYGFGGSTSSQADYRHYSTTPELSTGYSKTGYRYGYFIGPAQFPIALASNLALGIAF